MSKSKYVQSSNCSIIKSKNGMFLFNSLSLERVSGKNFINLFNLFRNPRNIEDVTKSIKYDANNGLKFLIKNKFIVPENDISKELEYIQKDRKLERPHISSLMLSITTNCNFNCKYCFIDCNNRQTLGMMDESTANKSIDTFLRIADEKTKVRKITFYGGEPLINFEVIKSSFSHLDNLAETGAFDKHPMIIELITNGSLINEDIAKFLSERKSTVVLSLDGRKHEHDKMRVYNNDHGTWDDIIRNLKLLKNEGINPIISCTIGSHNIFDIEDVIEFFIADLDIKNIGLNLLKGVDEKNPSYVSPDIVSKKLLDAFDVFYNHGLCELRLMNKIKNFQNKKIKLHTCGAYGGQISVIPDGQLGACQVLLNKKKFVIGNISESDIISRINNSKIFAEWCKRSPINMKQCFGCVWQGVCGGGCAYESFRKTKSIWDLDKEFCDITKDTLNWFVKK